MVAIEQLLENLEEERLSYMRDAYGKEPDYAFDTSFQLGLEK